MLEIDATELKKIEEESKENLPMIGLKNYSF